MGASEADGTCLQVCPWPSQEQGRIQRRSSSQTGPSASAFRWRPEPTSTNLRANRRR